MPGAFAGNLLEFTERFASDEACAEYLAGIRWPNGFVCPRCRGTTGWLTNRGTYFCGACDRQTSLTAGTIMHQTHVPVRSRFLAMWLVCTQKTGLSAAGRQRELGLASYRTAWLMLQKLRQAMVRVGREQLVGVVQIDETYVGGDEQGLIGRKHGEKMMVAIAVELDGRKIGRIRLGHIADASAASLLPFVTEAVQAGATIHTDGWRGYRGVAGAGYAHRVTPVRGDQRVTQQAFPQVHLVASLLKRWLTGTHQGKVQPKHLPRYLDEFTFRFNRRRSRHVGQLFHRLAAQVVLRQAKSYREIAAN